MYQCSMTPYEGSQPYIFVSYAHKDSDEVLPILDRLNDLGYRIWYDDGIAPGSEWPEYIATHLDGARLVLAFVSPNSIASANCRREVTFSHARNKAFVGIYLRETAMSLGMEMQFSAEQCIMKYGMAEETFFTRLCSVTDMAMCRGTTAASAAKKAAPEPPAGQRPAPISDEDMAAVGIMNGAVSAAKNRGAEAPEDRPVPKNRKAGKPVPSAAAPKKKSRKKLLIIPAAILVIAIAAAAVVFSQRVTICGETYQTDDTFVSLNGQTVTDADISAMNRMKNLRSVFLTDCEITGGLADLDASALGIFEAENCAGMNDFTFLADAQELKTLTLENCGVTDSSFPDLSELTGLRDLDLSGNPDFSDIDSLPLENVTALDLSGTAVSDFAPIAAMTTLTSLDISNTAIENPAETILSLKLTELRMDNVPAEDYAFADALTVLNTLSVCSCGGDGLSDVLEKNAGTLTTILMDGNDFYEPGTRITMAGEHVVPNTSTALRECTLTETLSINNCSVASSTDFFGSSLDFAESMSNLSYISAVNCGLSDVSGLNSCTNLTEVHLDSNCIESVDFSALMNLTFLTLDGNSISDLSGLPDNSYKALTLLGNPICLSTLALTQGGRTLVLDYEEGLEDYLTALSNWSYVYIVGCPLDRQVALEDAAGLTTYFVDEAGAQEAEESIASAGNGLFIVPDVSMVGR